jgi:hypothetical protein
MNSQPPGRIDRRAAEHLIGDRSIGVRNGHPPLTALLTAAAVPGRPDELNSEQASLAAFRTAHLNPASQPGSLAVIRTAMMKFLTVKVIAVAAVITATGGVALAASTGSLPNPLAKPAPAASSGPSAAQPAVPPSRAPHTPGPSRTAKQATAGDGFAAPSPSLVGLCHAYGAGNKAEHGKALDNPAFSALITAAGGKDKVEMFCQALQATPTPAVSGIQPGGKPDKDDRADRTAKPDPTSKR